MHFTKAQRNDINEAIQLAETNLGFRVLQIVTKSGHGFNIGNNTDPLELNFVYVYPRDRYLLAFDQAEKKTTVYTDAGLKMTGTELRHFVEQLVTSKPSAQEFSRNEHGMFKGTAGFTGALESLGKKVFNPESGIAYVNFAVHKLEGIADGDFDLKETVLRTYLNLMIAESIMVEGRFPAPFFNTLLSNSKWTTENHVREQLLVINGDMFYGRPSVISTDLIEKAQEYHHYLTERYRAGQFKKDPAHRAQDICTLGDKFLVEWINYFESERQQNA